MRTESIERFIEGCRTAIVAGDTQVSIRELVAGIFAGREDNIFWRRAGDRIEAARARSLGVRDVTVLGPEVIHSVTNPVGKMTQAIHVYGGDFFAPVRPRSEWDPETLVERPWNSEDTRQLFATAEARSGAIAAYRVSP
jgi:predicted metal-dependent enzyme (double-stranded beta helix superfamily)